MVLNKDKSYKEKIQSLEELELNEQDESNENIYKQLLIYYIIDDQPMLAKFLWKRIPIALKSDINNELNNIWSVIKPLIQRNYSQAFQIANNFKKSNKTWSSVEIGQLLDRLIETSKEKLFDLISLAYSSINIQEFSNLLGLSTDEAKHIALSREWVIDGTNLYLLPKKKQEQEVFEIQHELQLEQLTNLVSFLENS